MNTAEALLKSVGIPGEIVIDHEMRALQIQPSPAASVATRTHTSLSCMNRSSTLRALRSIPPVDCDNCLFITEKGTDFVCQIA